MAEAAAEATEHVVLAELDIVEEQLRGIGRMQADLVEIAAALETGQRGVEREQRRALGAGFRIGLGGKQDHAGMMAVDRKSAVQGQSVSVRVVFGGRRIIKIKLLITITSIQVTERTINHNH